MKLFVVFCVFAVAFVAASPTANNERNQAESADAEATNAAQPEVTRERKSASYGGGYGASIPVPPCPKNYMFSCQPNLAPVPCAAPSYGSAGGYGSAGAYSAPVPTFATPYNYLQPAYAYQNQYYQY